jgi:uncharacterized protein (DUF1697 family)
VPKYVAFLRGVNLASRRRVSNAKLVSIVEALGFDGVAAFRTSGNVIFDAPRRAETKLIATLEGGLQEGTGMDVSVFLRNAAQVRDIAKQMPFTAKQLRASKRKMQVLLLAKKPAAKERKLALAEQTEEDRLAFGDRELYWLPRAGTQESTLDRKRVEELIGPTTGRTKRMLEEIEAKFFS